MFINDRHGAFEDRSSWANLGGQIFVLNVAHADFDNDGNLDVLLMRGAWEKPARLSLLRKQGRRGPRGRDGRCRPGRADLDRIGGLG